MKFWTWRRVPFSTTDSQTIIRDVIVRAESRQSSCSEPINERLASFKAEKPVPSMGTEKG